MPPTAKGPSTVMNRICVITGPNVATSPRWLGTPPAQFVGTDHQPEALTFQTPSDALARKLTPTFAPTAAQMVSTSVVSPPLWCSVSLLSLAQNMKLPDLRRSRLRWVRIASPWDLCHTASLGRMFNPTLRPVSCFTFRFSCADTGDVSSKPALAVPPTIEISSGDARPSANLIPTERASMHA